MSDRPSRRGSRSPEGRGPVFGVRNPPLAATARRAGRAKRLEQVEQELDVDRRPGTADALDRTRFPRQARADLAESELEVAGDVQV